MKFSEFRKLSTKEMKEKIKENLEMAQNPDHIGLTRESPEKGIFKTEEQYRDLRTASLNLIEACLIVIRYYDGTHRMAQAVSDLLRVIANETNNTP